MYIYSFNKYTTVPGPGDPAVNRRDVNGIYIVQKYIKRDRQKVKKRGINQIVMHILQITK